jgi:hypothetical protein
MNSWHSLGTRLRAGFEDVSAFFRRFVANAAVHEGGPSEDTALLKAWSIYPGQVNEASTRLTESAMVPLAKEVKLLSRKYGIAQEEAFFMLDQAATIYHVVTEAAEIHRRQLVEDLENASEEDALMFQEHLDIYDRFQETGRAVTLTAEQAALMSRLEDVEYEEGEEFVPDVPGGVALVERRRQWSRLQELFTEEELLHVKDLTVAGYLTVMNELLEKGVIHAEDLKKWPAYVSYVALNVPKNKSALQGFYPELYVFNPRRTDYRRHGSRTPAEGAITNLARAIDNAAETVGRRDFDREFHRFYELLANRPGGTPGKGDTFGIRRVRMTDDESNFVGRHRNNFNIMQAPGWVIRTRVKTKDGGSRLVSYKYYFDLADPRETELLNRSITAMRNRNVALRALAKANKWQGLALTKFKPAFAIGAAAKDFVERFSNQFARDRFTKADGTFTTGPKITLRMGSLLLNPGFWSDFMKTFVAGQKVNSPIGRYLEEFRTSGANFTILSLVKSLDANTSAADLKRQQLASRSVVRKALIRAGDTGVVRAVDGIFNKWNDAWNSFAPSLQYAAMRLEGMSVKDATADVLDMMNYYKKGSLDNLGSAIYLFYRPVMQGGANMLRSLLPGEKSSPAAKMRGAVTLLALTALSMMIHGLLSAMAGDDDDPDAVNPYDALPFETISRNMVIPLPGGSFAKVPIGFGYSIMAWKFGGAVHRAEKGLLTPEQALSHMALAFMKETSPDTMPAYAFSDAPAAFTLQTLTPALFRVVTDLAVNRDYFGGRIKLGSASPGVRDFEKGRTTTAPMWHDMARTVQETLHIDATPETWRYIMMNGPLPFLGAALGEADSRTLVPKQYPSAHASLGPFLSLLGVDSFWKPKADAPTQYAYMVKDALEKDFLRTGVRTTDSEQHRTHDQKVTWVAGQMKDKGYSADEMRAYRIIMDLETAVNRNSREFAQAASRYRYDDIEMSDRARRGLEKYADRAVDIYQKAGSRLYGLDVFGKGLGRTARDRPKRGEEEKRQ